MAALRFLRLSGAVLVFSLSACSWLPAAQDDDAQAMQSERARSAQQAWTLKARVQTPDQRASMRWRQTNQSFDVLLRGPFGFGSLRLHGTPQRVEIDDGETLTISTDPVQEIWQRSGIYVPIDAMPYWIRGLPAPSEPAILQRNLAGRVVTVDAYQLLDGVSFPYEINLERERWSLSLEIRKWQID
jgi:outer membrane lipoprotein LolB